MSHDLRTPLTSISGSVSLLLDNYSDLSPDERHKLLSDVFTESIWLNRFVENLLSLTRIDDHLMKINIRPELVEEVIGETVSLVRRRLNTCQVKVSIPDKPVMVNMDSSLIEQVLINLIDNAAAHTPLNGLIELSVVAEGGQMVFRVRDHGPGILPDDFEKIFERYFVGSETRFDLKRGQGLGLSICQSILQAHQSRLTAANHPDGGAVFEFALSLAMEG